MTVSGHVDDWVFRNICFFRNIFFSSRDRRGEVTSGVTASGWDCISVRIGLHQEKIVLANGITLADSGCEL